MIEVRTNSPLDGDYLKRDEQLIAASKGHPPISTGIRNGCREYDWGCWNTAEAEALIERLSRIEGVNVSIKE